MNSSFSLLLKPASFDCNLRCSYCFYLPKEELFGSGIHRMSFEMLETVTRNYLTCPMERHSFGWQGGEPTLMGVGFFRQAVALQEKYRTGPVGNAIQTNGTLLDDEWGEFLHRHNFLTGISIDGPRAIHDASRSHADGRGSHAEVMRGVNILKRHKAEFNALTLVSAANQGHPEEVYAYLKEQEIHFHQYIECVEFDASGQRPPFALAPGQWGEFLCRIFDAWYPADSRTVSIRLFDSILSRLLTGAATICPMSGNCCNYFVVEHDGGIYPCDFFVREELKLGNAGQNRFSELAGDPRYLAFGERKNPHSAKCEQCRYLPLCMGDCPKNRRGTESSLCEDWQIFYSHTIGRFEKLAADIAGRTQSTERNDPCPCGSGRKYKKCCEKS